MARPSDEVRNSYRVGRGIVSKSHSLYSASVWVPLLRASSSTLQKGRRLAVGHPGKLLKGWRHFNMKLAFERGAGPTNADLMVLAPAPHNKTATV